MSDLYLETGMDLRRAKVTLDWIQNTLRHAASRRIKPSFVLIKLLPIIGNAVLELLIIRGHERIKASDKFLSYFLRFSDANFVTVTCDKEKTTLACPHAVCKQHNELAG